MAKIYSQLEKAQLENTTSDTASLPKGMVTYRTDVNRAKVSNGTSQRELIDEDSFSPTEIATPAVPVAGRRKVYFKTDGVLYQLNSLGAEVPIGSGGGGGSLEWLEIENSPVASIENFARMFTFEAGLQQKLHTTIKVPASYIPGFPIKLLNQFISQDTAGDVTIGSTTTLIRKGIDAINSVVNQHTGSESIALSGGSVNIPQEVELELSSATGTINGVAISPGDLLIVELRRNADTSLLEAKMPIYGSDVTYT